MDGNGEPQGNRVFVAARGRTAGAEAEEGSGAS
jgi:hypothetical protein